MRFTLFDDQDLKALEDTIAKAMTRAIVSALKIASRDGLLLRPEPSPRAAFHGKVTEKVSASDYVKSVVVGAPPTVRPIPEPEWPGMEPTPEHLKEPAKVPVFLKPPPEQPFPKGKAVEPPPLKREAKTRKLYLQLYKTVADRPHGYVSVQEACKFLGGPKFSGPVSTWLQKGELDACIVASEKPTKGLPGKLMISKQSLVARDQRRRANRQVSPAHRKTADRVTHPD